VLFTGPAEVNADAQYFFYALAKARLDFLALWDDYTGLDHYRRKPPQLHGENYGLSGTDDREIARLNFEGKLKTAVEG